MSKLILHIGAHKTGTTSLQSFFRANINAFKDRGIYVPRFPKYPMMDRTIPNRNRNGYFLMLASKFAVYPEVWTAENQACIDRDLARFKELASEYDAILLSDEAIWLEGAQDKKYWIRCKEIVEEAGIDEVQLVVYLRRQDEFATSYWRHQIKGIEWGTLASFLRRTRLAKSLEYRRALADIDSVFGEGHIAVRVFDRATFVGGDIYHDFCDAAGIAWQDDFVIPEMDLNPSLTVTATEIKRWANANERYRNSSNFLMVPAIHLSMRRPGQPDTSTMTPELYETIKATHESDNEYVAQKYLNGNGGKLVRWPEFNKKKWEYLSLDVLQSVVQVFAEAMARQEEHILAQREEIKQQKQIIEEFDQRIARLETINRKSIGMKVERHLRGRKALEGSYMSVYRDPDAPKEEDLIEEDEQVNDAPPVDTGGAGSSGGAAE